ncbi:MAG: LuxR C-terminal-related transcriptional regulator [Tannerella sp.]|jgi:DNA-binding NarL/FixJ family response regulator|nr:LuxR C-terminal-related transcriptional regulator [Tannerella sp.]
MKQIKKYRTVIIEPSEIIREGIKLFLEKHSAFQVTACFSDLPAFEDRHIKKEDIHIVLFNPAIVKFYKPFNIRNLFTDYPDIYLIAVLYQYVDDKTLQHFDGVLDMYDEGWMIPKKIIKIIETVHRENSQPVENIELSDREKEILIALAKGLISKEIADKLNISTHTVISHRKNIVRKTGIKTVSGLTLYALFNNLISQDELL